jgi:hypothetical protein
MKIRLNNRSIRFRLGSSELDALFRDGVFQETVRLGVQPSDFLRFEVHIVEDLEQMSFLYSGDSLRISVPKAWLPEWRSGKKIGYEMKHSLGESFQPLKIVVESDLE